MKKKRSQSHGSVGRRTFLGQGAVAAAGMATPGCAQSLARGIVDGTRVASVAIYPPIGMARVGNSDQEPLLAPEVPALPVERQADPRDTKGAIRRQAARFRVYAFDRDQNVLGEITSAQAEITWTVHLANKKADWYRFLVALDIPEASEVAAPQRNADVKDRASLVIDPGPRSVGGRAPSSAAFDTGRFKGRPVHLGEINLDSEGRLRVLGGWGKAGSVPEGMSVFDPSDFDTFNNADGWYDDIADGPVRALVRFRDGGQPFEAKPAWVVVAPPNYAPRVTGWRTLYDLLVDTYVDAEWLAFPEETSFARDVQPILSRLANLQWVNQGFADAFSHDRPHPFGEADYLQRLASRERSPALDEERLELVRRFRPPDDTYYQKPRWVNTFDAVYRSPVVKDERQRWPWLYGDAFGSFDTSMRVNLALTRVQAEHLGRWAQGRFVNDFQRSAATRLEELPPSAQPATLTRAALDDALADAFHPGCEVTWPIRHLSMYSEPFRIRHREEGESPTAPRPSHLTMAVAAAPGGPLHAQGPGDLTRWMAIPWQGDTVFCRSGYDPDYDPYLPSFWPARVPNQVLSEEDYRIVADTTRGARERLEAFHRRQSWVRNLQGSAPEQILQMVRGIEEMGILEPRRIRADGLPLPSVVLVERLPEKRPARGLASVAEAAPKRAETERAWAEFRELRRRNRR